MKTEDVFQNSHAHLCCLPDFHNYLFTVQCVGVCVCGYQLISLTYHNCGIVTGSFTPQNKFAFDYRCLGKVYLT